MLKELGELRSVNIRDVWALEPQHFSTWLADNLPKLGRAIGIELELRQREVAVGPFSVDILAHDVDRDRVVIIENQLGRTDHDHLGKLITYAAGLKAQVIVWISPEFREEHRAALDWLNENTDETREFFAIQIEALQIDDSRPAANFKVVAFPNDWQKLTNAVAQRGGDASARRAFFLEYFSELSSNARAAGFPRAQTASGQFELVIDRLPAGSYLAAAFSRDTLPFGLYIARNDAAENRRIYEALLADSSQIESEIGINLQWDFIEGRVRQQIWTSIRVDRQDSGQLDSSRKWVLDVAKKFKTTFEPRLIRIARANSLVSGETT